MELIGNLKLETGQMSFWPFVQKIWPLGRLSNFGVVLVWYFPSLLSTSFEGVESVYYQGKDRSGTNFGG